MHNRQEIAARRFDPFGEELADRLGTTPEGDRRARRAALAVFWTLALLLTAGQIWQHGIAFSHPVVELASR